MKTTKKQREWRRWHYDRDRNRALIPELIPAIEAEEQGYLERFRSLLAEMRVKA